MPDDRGIIPTSGVSDRSGSSVLASDPLTRSVPIRSDENVGSISSRTGGILAPLVSVPILSNSPTSGDQTPSANNQIAGTVQVQNPSALQIVADLFRGTYPSDIPAPAAPSIVSVPVGSNSSGGSGFILLIGIVAIGALLYWYYKSQKGASA